jgi:hypothetical protein
MGKFQNTNSETSSQGQGAHYTQCWEDGDDLPNYGKFIEIIPHL